MHKTVLTLSLHKRKNYIHQAYICTQNEQDTSLECLLFLRNEMAGICCSENLELIWSVIVIAQIIETKRKCKWERKFWFLWMKCKMKRRGKMEVFIRNSKQMLLCLTVEIKTVEIQWWGWERVSRKMTIVITKETHSPKHRWPFQKNPELWGF